MGLIQIARPLINGHVYSFASADFSMAGIRVGDLKSIDYKDSLKPGKHRGPRPQVVGRTLGEYDAEGSFEMAKLEFQILVAELAKSGRGFKEVAFDIPVSYAEDGSPTITDTLVGCRITETSDSHKEGSEALYTKCSMDILYVLWNGASSLTRLLR